MTPPTTEGVGLREEEESPVRTTDVLSHRNVSGFTTALQVQGLSQASVGRLGT